MLHGLSKSLYIYQPLCMTSYSEQWVSTIVVISLYSRERIHEGASAEECHSYNFFSLSHAHTILILSPLFFLFLQILSFLPSFLIFIPFSSSYLLLLCMRPSHFSPSYLLLCLTSFPSYIAFSLLSSSAPLLPPFHPPPTLTLSTVTFH